MKQGILCGTKIHCASEGRSPITDRQFLTELSEVNNYDPKYRTLATYQVAEAARFLRMRPGTLRVWLKGNRLLRPPAAQRTQLSFLNLVEAHVLSALRGKFGLSMQRIRIALDELRNQWPDVGYPLATEAFFTDGKYLLVEKLGQLFNLNQGSQIEVGELIQVYLRRIDRDEIGPVRLHPFTVDPEVNPKRAEKRTVLISPYVSFGRPSITGIGVATEVVYDRFIAGDTLSEMCMDYRLTPVQIEEVLRYESAISRAA